MTAMLPESSTNQVFQSYGRCCQNERFFEDFYSTFMSRSDEVRAMFDNTDMAEQRRLLRAGISWLIMYARGSSGLKLHDLGKSHNREGYNVRPAWYELWVDALVETVARHDPECTPELEQEWRQVLHPGIELMRSVY